MEKEAEQETRVLVSAIVAECFPDEAPLTEHFSRVGAPPRVGDGPLGIGAAELVPLALPFLWSLVAEVLAALRGAVATAVAKQIADWIRSNGEQPRTSASPHALPAEFLEVADSISKELQRNGLARGREQVVAAVVLRVLMRRTH